VFVRALRVEACAIPPRPDNPFATSFNREDVCYP
jgi:hypothetical protein